MIAVRWYLRYGLSYRDVEEQIQTAANVVHQGDDASS
jgi:transposase-like protein